MWQARGQCKEKMASRGVRNNSFALDSCSPRHSSPPEVGKKSEKASEHGTGSPACGTPANSHIFRDLEGRSPEFLEERKTAACVAEIVSASSSAIPAHLCVHIQKMWRF